MIETTLCLLRKDNKILLPRKKRGVGAGKFNGVGGKIEQGETPEQAMIRETQEEIECTPTDYEKVGFLEFDEFFKGKKEKVSFYLYIVNDWIGEPTETDEMEPKWFDLEEIPYDKMFPDDRYWLPRVIEGKKIKAYFNFDEEWNILEQKIVEE